MNEHSTPTPGEQEVTILVGGVAREEFLGEPERIDFVQPKRSISKHSSKPPSAEQPPADE